MRIVVGSDKSLHREGNVMTTLVVPEGTPMPQAINEVVAALQYHIKPGVSPVWVEADADEGSKMLAQMLRSHFGIQVSRRPEDW